MGSMTRPGAGQGLTTRETLVPKADSIALIPIIAALGGPEALVETVRAIQDVGRWWP